MTFSLLFSSVWFIASSCLFPCGDFTTTLDFVALPLTTDMWITELLLPLLEELTGSISIT